MRIVSWVVILGSVSALLYSGVWPWVSDIDLPPVDGEQALGAVADDPQSRLEACIRKNAGEDVPEEALDGVVDAGISVSEQDLSEIRACREKHLAQN